MTNNPWKSSSKIKRWEQKLLKVTKRKDLRLFLARSEEGLDVSRNRDGLAIKEKEKTCKDEEDFRALKKPSQAK